MEYNLLIKNMESQKVKFKILVVDDEECIRECLCYVLGKNGFIVEDAENGEVALKKIAQDKPDIIILDILMPVLDGLETLKRLRQNPQTRDIPVIFFSAQNSKNTIHRDYPMAGAPVIYLEKPCDINILLAPITRLKN